jgi:hypothetical protein
MVRSSNVIDESLNDESLDMRQRLSCTFRRAAIDRA